jgi:hypothetical protein
METTGSSETSVFYRTKWRHFPEDDNFYSHRLETLKLLKANTVC